MPRRGVLWDCANRLPATMLDDLQKQHKVLDVQVKHVMDSQGRLCFREGIWNGTLASLSVYNGGVSYGVTRFNGMGSGTVTTHMLSGLTPSACLVTPPKRVFPLFFSTVFPLFFLEEHQTKFDPKMTPKNVFSLFFPPPSQGLLVGCSAWRSFAWHRCHIHRPFPPLPPKTPFFFSPNRDSPLVSSLFLFYAMMVCCVHADSWAVC